MNFLPEPLFLKYYCFIDTGDSDVGNTVYVIYFCLYLFMKF